MRTALGSRFLSWSMLAAALSVGGCGSGMAAAPAPAHPSREAPGFTEGGAEKLVVTGEVTAVADDVAGLAAAIGARAVEIGGSLAREEIGGDAQRRQALIVVRLPPPAVGGFVDWIASRASLESRRLQTTDVSRQFFDRDLAIHNLEITMERLQALVQRPNAELKDIIAIENEMTRVRGELEKLRGEQRLLGDQIARATLSVTVQARPDLHAEPELKFEVVPHLTLLHLVDAGSRAADRTGLGASVMFARSLSLDFEVLPRQGADARSYLFTLSTATYSDFLGGGHRRFGNPYLGLRVGGASMNGLGALAYGAEAGVELVRCKLFLIEISGRALGLWYHRDNPPHGDIVFEGIAGIGVPF
jgi:hypothetical protein